jgi:hypothetical protein
MSDYTKTTNFTDKDSRTTGDPLKVIKGSYFDQEFDDIATAVATKYDSGDLASQEQAELEASNVTLMTPLRVANWADYNAGVVGDLQAWADPNADAIFGWDDSAGAAIGFTMGTGLGFNGATIEISHLGIEDLVDPNADRIMFWDDSAGFTTWLTVSTGLTLTGTSLTTDDTAIVHDSLSGFVADEHVAHSGVTMTAGTGLSGGGTIDATRTFNLDISGLTALSGASVAATDGYLVDDGGTMKRIAHQSAGIPKIVDATTTPTPSSAQVNSYWYCTSGSATTFTLNTSVGEAGNVLIIQQAGAGQITIGGSATIESAFGSNASRTVDSVMVLYCTAANTWTLYGDCV